MTTQSGLQSGQERKILFAQGRQIATNTAKRLSSRQTAEAARDVLLHFDHTKIALGEIVIKIHAQIFKEAEDRFLVFAQPVEQVACGALFDPPFGPRQGRRSGSDVIPFIEQAEKCAFPIEHFQRIEPALALVACVLGGGFHAEEQVFEFGRPDGSLLLRLKHQLAEQMHQAERMLTCIQEVRAPGIMDTDAFEDRQDANRVQGVLSAALIHMIMGEGRRTRHMLPVSFPSDRHAGFVLMKHGGLDQGLFDLLLDGSHLRSGALDQFPHCPFTHLHSQQITHHLTGPPQRQQLLLGQRDRCGSNQRSILDGGRYCDGKRGKREVLTAGTLFLFCSVFLHDQLWRWYVYHLPTQGDTGLDLPQIMLKI